VDLHSKIISWAELATWRSEFRCSGRRLVVTNGCFDLIHAGHVSYLERARNLGDALLVGLNSDASVRELKGPGRPVNSEADRAIVLAGLESVSAVTVFSDRSAGEFLRLAAPDIYVKGGDYTLESLDQGERQVVERVGGRIVLMPFVPGKSTRGLLEAIRRSR